MTDQIGPGERRELRSVVRGQFKVLRSEVARRKAELTAEIEAELVQRYRDEDAAVADAQRDTRRAINDAALAIRKIGDDLRERFPDLTVEAQDSYGRLGLSAGNGHRSQLHRALIAAIPDKIGDALLSLDRQEADLLRRLSEGVLESDEARAFLGQIPSVGELVPRQRLREIESALDVTP